MTSPLSERLANSLANHVAGNLLCDSDSLERYSRSQGWYRILPLCVLQPDSVEDVSIAIRVCADLGVAVIPRGAGTGLAGQAIGYGLIIDSSRALNRVVEAGPDWVRVQAGLVLQDLNATLKPSGRWFPIDPTSAPHCTIGGMCATNAAGWHGPAYGATKDHVLSCTVVLADGTIATIGGPESPPVAGGRIQEIAMLIESLLRPHEGRIGERFPRVAKNSSGYNFPDALASRPVDLVKLIIGSEGTLGYLADVTLRTAPIPNAAGGVLVSCTSYRPIIQLLRNLERGVISAAEFMDESFVSIGSFPKEWRSASGGPLLYLDVFGASSEDVGRRLEKLTATVEEIDGLRPITLSGGERDAVFACRREVSEKINFDVDWGKSSFIEDVSVPVERLGEYVAFIGDYLESKSIRYALYGHAAEGNIHCSPFVDIHHLDHYRMIDEIASTVASKVISLGGSLSGEHGDGFVRTPFLERAYGREIFALFQGVKDIFDPHRLFLPGVIAGKQEASILHDIAHS